MEEEEEEEEDTKPSIEDDEESPIKSEIKEESNSFEESPPLMRKRKHSWPGEEPGGKVIKEERDVSSSYSLQSSGGLKFVIKNSPSPCPPKDNLQIKVEKEDIPWAISPSDMSVRTSSPKREPMSDVDDGDSAVSYRSSSERRSSVLSEQSMSHSQVLADMDDNAMYPSPMQRHSHRTASYQSVDMDDDPPLSPVPTEQPITVSDISYASSQGGGHNSESDSAVAGLLLSHEWPMRGAPPPPSTQRPTQPSPDLDLIAGLDSSGYSPVPSSSVAQDLPLLPTAGGDMFNDPPSPMGFSAGIGGVVGDMFSDPESPMGLNGEMESAINSILSLQQGSQSFSTDNADDSFASASHVDLTQDSSFADGDDLEAAVNSILMWTPLWCLLIIAQHCWDHVVGSYAISIVSLLEIP